jgi:hypothetical protein
MKRRSREDSPPAFRRFRKLPKELRLKIWEDCAESIEPQVIRVVDDTELTYVQQPGTKNATFDIEEDYKFKVICKRPALMHANHESRQVASKYYTKAFKSYFGHPIYINLKEDILHLQQSTNNEMLKDWQPEETVFEEMLDNYETFEEDIKLLKKVRRLSWEEASEYCLFDHGRKLAKLFPGVKELFLLKRKRKGSVKNMKLFAGMLKSVSHCDLGMSKKKFEKDGFDFAKLRMVWLTRRQMTFQMGKKYVSKKEQHVRLNH